MLIQKDIDLNRKLTPEEVAMLEALEDFEDEYDEDCPPLTDEQLSKMYRVSEKNREERLKQTVTLRISRKALNKARSLGKGYTSVLSRILEDALKDDKIIEKHL